VSVAEAVETVPEGGLYVVNDKGERKATGAYYTPDYVVTYIVEETVGPLVEEIREDLRRQGFSPGTQEYLGAYLQRATDLKILDPAMGSGHFLTRATGYLAEEVMAEVREVEEETGIQFDEQHVRREIAKECIYGVDVNGMATELAKLSMWLETLSADRPLAFLDHHLKTGNSLVGSDVTEVLTDDNGDSGQLTLTQALTQVRQDTLEHVMELIEELLAIDNETLSDVESMEEIYEEIRADPLFQRLFELTNVHTAERFGVDVPEGVYEEMAGAIKSAEEWEEIRGENWFNSAQGVAEDQRIFHWELEYPEVFFNVDGQKAENSGFDVVIGNPPYVRIYGDTLPDDYVEYLRSAYETAHMKFDLYVVFSQLGIELCREGGMFSYIIPDKFTSTPYGEPLRELVLSTGQIESILDLRSRKVFENVTVSNLVPVLKKSEDDQESLEIRSMGSRNSVSKNQLPMDAVILDEDCSIRLSRSVDDMRLSQKIRDQSIRFDKIYYTNWGLRTGTKQKTDKYVVEETEDSRAHPMIRGKNVRDSYRLETPKEHIVYNKADFYNPMFEELFENDKIVFRKISGRGLMAVVDEDHNYCFSTLICCVNISNVSEVNRAGIPETTTESELYDNIYYPLAIVNSTLLEWYYSINLSDDLSVVPGHINELPIAEIEKINKESNSDVENDVLNNANKYVNNSGSSGSPESCSDLLEKSNDRVAHDLLSELAKNLSELHQTHLGLNLALLDHLGSYSYGTGLSEIGLTQPAKGAADAILQKTAEEHSNLRVGEANVRRKSPTIVEIRLTARYKPDDEDAHETDQWGYAETDMLPALRISELSETEADLIEHFVPVAVDEAGGFADFRETATKTNSLVDRLRNLTLPRVDDVEFGLESYVETKERAEELEAKIERTDELIDEVVYELYGLTDEEIEIVEEAVGE
jgi:hypothetical protein